MTDILRSRLVTNHDAYEYNNDVEELLPIPMYEGILGALNDSEQEQFSSAYGDRTVPSPHPHPLNPYGSETERITRDKIMFASSRKVRNMKKALVVFHHRLAPGTLCAGQINKIYLHSRNRAGNTVVEPFNLMKKYVLLNPTDEIKDPYRKWPDINTCMCYNELEEEARIVRMEDVVVHFAAYVYTPQDIDRECIVVRNLDRICMNVFGFTNQLTSFVIRTNP